MATAPDGRPLIGRHVRLDIAQDVDAADLFAALDHTEVWASGYNGGPAARPVDPDGWLARMATARKDERLMYVVRLHQGADAGRIVGTTSLGDTDVVNERTHIGWTAYAPEVWSTAVNPECKLLLLTHAFEDCGFGRVKIQTDLLNTRSQAAIAKLGAVREGVLRRHQRRGDGTFRDTVVFSITLDDWPAVRAGLEARLVKG